MSRLKTDEEEFTVTLHQGVYQYNIMEDRVTSYKGNIQKYEVPQQTFDYYWKILPLKLTRGMNIIFSIQVFLRFFYDLRIPKVFVTTWHYSSTKCHNFNSFLSGVKYLSFVYHTINNTVYS